VGGTGTDRIGVGPPLAAQVEVAGSLERTEDIEVGALGVGQVGLGEAGRVVSGSALGTVSGGRHEPTGAAGPVAVDR
jgi:hypothetical protein